VQVNSKIIVEANFDGFNISKAEGSLIYDCSEYGQVKMKAYIGKISLQTTMSLEIRAVDFELLIEKGMKRADGTLVPWVRNKTVELGSMSGSLSGYLDIDNAEFRASPGARHALAVPTGDATEADITQLSNDEAALGGGEYYTRGDYTPIRHHPLIYLDRLSFSCRSTEAMRGWGIEWQHYGRKLLGGASPSPAAPRYHQPARSKTLCEKSDRQGVDIALSQCKMMWTSPAVAHGGIIWLAWHRMKCPVDHFLNYWKLHRYTPEKVRLRYRCCKAKFPVSSNQAAFRVTNDPIPANPFAGQLEYLDRVTVKCPANSGAIEAGFPTLVSNMYVAPYLVCAYLPTTPSPPPSPFPPPAPPPPSPPPDSAYYNISGKISGVVQFQLEDEANVYSEEDTPSIKTLKILASVYFDIPRRLYSVAVSVFYLADTVKLKVKGRIDLDFSDPDQIKYCDIDLEGYAEVDLTPTVSTSNNSKTLTDDSVSGGNKLRFDADAKSRCPKQDGITKYEVNAKLSDFTLFDGGLTGDLIQVHGTVWKYGPCTPDVVVAEGETEGFTLSNYPGVLLGRVNDARRVRLLSATAGGKSIDPYYPAKCGWIIPDTRSQLVSTANASYWVFVSCQEENLRTIELKVNVLEGAAYVQAVSVRDWKNHIYGAGLSLESTAAELTPVLFAKFENLDSSTELNIAPTGDATDALGLKHVKWEIFETVDCDSVGGMLKDDGVVVAKENEKPLSRPPDSTDIYFFVRAENVVIDAAKIFGGDGTPFNVEASVSLYANLSSFNKNEFGLDYITFVVGVKVSAGGTVDKPMFSLGGTLNYTYPCNRGMDVVATNLNIEINIDILRIEGYVNITYPCHARVEDRQLQLTGYIEEISIGDQNIFDVNYDVDVFLDGEKIPDGITETSELDSGQFMKALVLKGSISGKAAVAAAGMSLGADVTFIFDSLAGTVTVAATITFESEYLSAVVKGAYSNDCNDLEQFDYISGNATLDVNNMVRGQGSISGSRYCMERAPTRYDIVIRCDYFIIEPVEGMKLELSGEVTAVGLANTDRTMKDDELTWNVEGNVTADLSLAGSAMPLAADELKLIDTRVDFSATFQKYAGVTDLAVAVGGAFRFASGGDPTAPLISLSGGFKFKYPCNYGDSVGLTDVHGAINIGTLSVKLEKSRAVLYCFPETGDMLYDISVVISKVDFDAIQILDVNVTGAGIVAPNGGSHFSGSLAGKMKVEGFQVDAFFLVNTATRSVKPSIKIKYTTHELKMELLLATSLKGGEIACDSVTMIQGTLEVNIAGGQEGEANKFKAKLNGYYNCSDDASPTVLLDAAMTTSLPVAGVFVNNAHIRMEGYEPSRKVTAFTRDETEAMAKRDEQKADQAKDEGISDKVVSICHLGGKLYAKPDATEPIGIYSHPGVNCNPHLISNDYEKGEPLASHVRFVDNVSDALSSVEMAFGTLEGDCCNANNDASIQFFGKDASLCCDYETLRLKDEKRCAGSRWCNRGTECKLASSVAADKMCAAPNAKLGDSSVAEKLMAGNSGTQRTYCHLGNTLYGLSDLAVYGVYPVPKCTPVKPKPKSFDEPPSKNVKTVPIEGILDGLFFRGYFFGSAEIAMSSDVGMPPGVEISAKVAIGFTVANPPMDFDLRDMILDAKISMNIQNMISIKGSSKFTYPATEPLPFFATVDFDLNAAGLDLPSLEADLTIYPQEVANSIRRGRTIGGTLKATSPFIFSFQSITVSVTTCVVKFDAFDNGRIVGEFIAKPSVAVSTGDVDVSLDMVIKGTFEKNNGEDLILEVKVSAEASLDLEGEYFGVHLKGAASNECKKRGITLAGDFWFAIPGVADSDLHGSLDVVKRCGKHYGDEIPMVEGLVGIAVWNMGKSIKLKNIFINFAANPGFGGEDDVASYSWFGDFKGSIDVSAGGLLPKGLEMFTDISVSAALPWSYNKTYGVNIGKIDVEASGSFAVGGGAGSNSIAEGGSMRLDMETIFSIPCSPSETIEANATLTLHVNGNPPLLSIAGASVAIFVPCNQSPGPKDVVVTIAERWPFTVTTPLASLEIDQVNFEIFGDKSMIGTIRAKPIDVDTIPAGTGMFGGSITYDTRAGYLAVDADYAWLDDTISVRATGLFELNESAGCDLGEWALTGTAIVTPTVGSIDSVTATVHVSHVCDGAKEVYNITGQITPFDIPQLGMKLTKGRIKLNGLTNDTGLVPHIKWNGTVIGAASINTESSENTLPALGSFETSISATAKFEVIGKQLIFTSFGANATFKYVIGDLSSDTFMELHGSIEMALPCEPGMVGKGKGAFKARMKQFQWDMTAFVHVYCGNYGPETPVITLSATTVGQVKLTDSIKVDRLTIDASAYHLDNGKYALKGTLVGLSDGLSSIFSFDTRTGEIAAAAVFNHQIPDWLSVRGSVGVAKGADSEKCVKVGVDVNLFADIRTAVVNANASIIGSYRSCGSKNVYNLKTYPAFSTSLDSSDEMKLVVKNVVLSLEGNRPKGMDYTLSNPDFDKLDWHLSGHGMIKIEAGRLLPTTLMGSAEFDMDYSPVRIVDGVHHPGTFTVNYVKVTLHMSFTAGPLDNPNIYVSGSTEFVYPAGKGARLATKGTVQIAFKDICNIKLAMEATAFVGASGSEPVFALKAWNEDTMTLKGITVTNFEVNANVYVHIGATPGYAVAGSMAATASVGSVTAAEAAAAGLGLSASGTLSLSFNTRYSLQLSMLTDFKVEMGALKIKAQLGVRVGTCPIEGNFINGAVTIKLSETSTYEQTIFGSVLCAPKAKLMIKNPDRDKSKCPVSWFPTVSDTINKLTTSPNVTNGTDSLPNNLKHLEVWTNGNNVPAKCELPRVYVKTEVTKELVVGPVTLVGASADIYGWGDISKPSEMTWAGEFFAEIKIDDPFPGFSVKFDGVGFGLKFDPEDGLQISPVITILTTTLEMGSAMDTGADFSFTGSLYAMWPCELGMTALFWGDVEMSLLGGKVEAAISVFTSYFCGVTNGQLLTFEGTLPRDKKIKIADLLEILDLTIDAAVYMKEGKIDGVKGNIQGTIDVTLPAVKNLGDMTLMGYVEFNTITNDYHFVMSEFKFTSSMMTVNAFGELVIGSEESQLYFEGDATMTIPGIVAVKTEIMRGLLRIVKPKLAAFLPTFELDIVLRLIELPGGVYVEDAHLGIELYVDSDKGVYMRADMNGTIGMGKSLPPALGDFGVSAFVDASLLIDKTGVSLRRKVNVVLGAFYESKKFGFLLEGQALFKLPSPDRVTFIATMTLKKFAGVVDGEFEATITVFINEDISAAAAVLGEAASKKLAIASSGARRVLAIPSDDENIDSLERAIPLHGVNNTDDASALGFNGRFSTKTGGCQYAIRAPIQFLDRQSFYCRSGSAMSAFRVANVCPWFSFAMASFTTCSSMSKAGSPLTMGACKSYWTPKQYINGHGGIFFNLIHFSNHVQCPKDHFMTGWKFRLNSWEYAQIQYSCCSSTLEVGPAKEVLGRCDLGAYTSNKLEYMDRHVPNCPSGSVMTGWGLSLTGCSTGRLRTRTNCVEIPVPPPPSPSPPPPPPPIPPSPPPPAYLVNGVAIKAFHVTTRIKKPITIIGVSINTLDLEMDVFKGSDKYYYKGSLVADADVDLSNDSAQLSGGAVFNFDTTSGQLVLESTLSITLVAGPFTINGKVERTNVCVDTGTVISGSLEVDAGTFQLPKLNVVFTQYCKPEQMTIIDLTGSMAKMQLMLGIVVKDMSMSLIGVRRTPSGSDAFEELDWTGSIGGTLATDGSFKIPGSVGDPTLEVKATVTRKNGVFDYYVHAIGTVQLAIGDAIKGTMTVDIVMPCKTGNKISFSGSIDLVLGDWLDQRFTAEGHFLCGDVEEDKAAITMSVTMPALVVQDRTLTNVKAELEMIKKGDDLSPNIKFSGSMTIMETYTASAALEYKHHGGEESELKLNADTSITLGLVDNAAIKMYCKVSVALHATLPITKLGDLRGSGKIELYGIPIWGLDDFKLEGETELQLGLDGEFKITATLGVTSGKKLRLFDFLEFDFPGKLGLAVAFQDGEWDIEVFLLIKNRYKFAARFNTDGSIMISGEAFNVGPLNFLQDLLNVNPWLWYDDLVAAGNSNAIMDAIGTLKQLTLDFLQCERLSIIYRLSGDGEHMLIAAATGCNLFLVKISVTVLVLDWTDVMVQLAIELGDFTFAGAFAEIDSSLKVLGQFMDIVVSPIKSLRKVTFGFSTIEIKKPEFPSEEYGLPSLSSVPKGFMLQINIDLMVQIQTAVDLIGSIMEDSFNMEDPMGPFRTFFSSSIWSPLANWPFMISFDMETVKFCLATSLEFSEGGLPIGDIRFKLMRISFCATVGEGDPEFAASGEMVMFMDIYPPLAIFNTMFGWMKPECTKDEREKYPRSEACSLFPTLAPLELMAMGYFEIGWSAVNGIFFAMGGFMKLTGEKDVVWANPFGLAPSMGLLFPYGFNFLEKISNCITEVSAAAAEIAATSGVALIWRVFTVAYYCLPADPEFEAGLMMCSSALYVDGKLPVDLGLNKADDEDKKPALGHRQAAPEEALTTLDENQEQPSSRSESAFVQYASLGPSLVEDQSLASLEPSPVSQLGDKRFDAAIMNRYTCASYDPFGTKPMYGFISMAIKFAWPKYKFAFSWGLSNVSFLRIFLAMAQFNPVSFLANYAMSTGESIIQDMGIDMSGIGESIGDFMSMFDIMQMGRCEASINLSPYPTRLMSGTKIPTGIYFMIKDLEFLFMYKIDLLLLNINIFSLEPAIDAHMFLPPQKFMLGGFHIKMEGADPSISKSLKRMLAKREADDARVMENERKADEDARAEQMQEMKESKKTGASSGVALGQAKHLGSIAKLGTGGWIPDTSRSTFTDDEIIECPQEVCNTCARVTEGTRLFLQCADDQEIFGFQDILWGVGREQPPWSFEDMPAACDLNVTDIKAGRMTVAAQRSQLMETIKALCVGKATCELDVTRNLFGDCSADKLDAGKCEDGSLELSVIAQCASAAVGIMVKNDALVKNMDDNHQCANGCKSCMTAAHSDYDMFFECDEGMIITGFEDAVYGDGRLLPQFEFDKHPTMCFHSVIPTASACVANKQEVIDILHKRCAGRAQCFIYSGEMENLLGYSACPGKAMNLTGIAKCMYTNQKEDQTIADENSFSRIQYSARRVGAVKTTDTYFAMNAEWTVNNKTEVDATKTADELADLELYSPSGTNGNVMHRLGTVFFTPHYKITGGLVYWNFRFTGFDAFVHAKLLVQATGRAVKGSPNLCDDLGKNACELKCGRKICGVRIPLRGSTRYIVSVLGVTNDAVSRRQVTVELKPPSVCKHKPDPLDPYNDAGADLEAGFKWDTLKAGQLRGIDCDVATKVSLLSLSYVAKPYCQSPEDFSAGMEACLPTKPLCKNDVINAAESSVGAGVKTAVYEWSQNKAATMRINGNGTCEIKGTNSKRLTKGRVMYLTFDGVSECEDGDVDSTAAAACAFEAEGDEASAKAKLYEFVAGKKDHILGKSHFTPLMEDAVAEYLEVDAKAGKHSLRFDRNVQRDDIDLTRVLVSHLDGAAHKSGTLSLYVKLVGAIPKDGEVIATFAAPHIIGSDEVGDIGLSVEVSEVAPPTPHPPPPRPPPPAPGPPPSYVTVGITSTGSLEMKAVYDGATVCYAESPVSKNRDLRLNNGHWHHVVLAVDADHPDGDVLTIYIDGHGEPLHCAEGNGANFTFQKAPSVNLSSIYLGAAIIAGNDKLTVSRAMQGEMDTVTYFNRALSKSEISFLAVDMPCSTNSIGGAGYAYFAGQHAATEGSEWVEFDLDACLSEAKAKTVTIAFNYLQSTAPKTNFTMTADADTQLVAFDQHVSTAADTSAWVDTVPVIIRGDGAKTIRLSRRLMTSSSSRLGDESDETALADFDPVEDHSGPAIDVAFLSSGAAYFTHRDLNRGLKAAFTSYEDKNECHMFEMNGKVSKLIESCVRKSDSSVDDTTNIFSRVAAQIMIDFKGQWFFKVDAGGAFALSFVITDEDGTVILEKTEYHAANSPYRLWFEKSVVLKAGTYTVEMFTMNSKQNAGEPFLMYKNPSPCGVDTWTSFNSEAQMKCEDPMDDAGLTNVDDDADVSEVTPTAAAAVNPYEKTEADLEDDNAHPARRLLSAAGGNDAPPNKDNPSSGIPLEKDYNGIMFSMHMGAKLSLEILDGLNDNYLIFSAQFGFMSFPGISVELSMIPSSGTGGVKGGIYAAFHFKINMWEIFSGIMDTIVGVLVTLVGSVIEMGAITASMATMNPAAMFTPPGSVTTAFAAVIEKMKEEAIKVGKTILDACLGLVGLDTNTILSWMEQAGFSGDMFEFAGSIDITPLDLGKIATFDFSALPSATIMIKMSPHAMNNLMAMGVSLVRAIVNAACAPVLMVVDKINGLLLGVKKTFVAIHNLLAAAKRALDSAVLWVNDRQREVNTAQGNLKYSRDRYNSHNRDAQCSCGVGWHDCACSSLGYFCNCGWRGCSTCYKRVCLSCPYENPSGCVARKARGFVKVGPAWIEVGVRQGLILAAQAALSLARRAIGAATALVTLFTKFIDLCQKVIDAVYNLFKDLMNPLVGICKSLKLSCMSGGALTTKPLWNFLRNFGRGFTLFKILYFQVSGTYDPDGMQSYSFKMPVTVWNVKYDLHGSFVVDPFQLLTNFFVMLWKFFLKMFGLDSAGASVAGADAAGVAGALGMNHISGARTTIYPARASNAALLGKPEVHRHIASALGVDRPGRFGVIASRASVGGDWNVGADIHAEEDFFTQAAHDAMAASHDSFDEGHVHQACAVALREHAQNHAQATMTDEPLACAAAGAAAAQYCSAASWSGEEAHAAEAACTHAIGAIAYTGIDTSLSQSVVCGGSAALASAAGACVAAALQELSCSTGCAEALASLSKRTVCGGMIPRRGGLRESYACSDAMTKTQKACNTGDGATRCASLLSAVPPVQVHRHAAALAEEGDDIGITMLSTIDWSQTNLAGVISAEDACAMRSQHIDVSFNNLAGELPSCLVDGTAAARSTNLGGNHFYTSDKVPKIGQNLGIVNLADNNIGGDITEAVQGGRPRLESLHVGGNARLSGDFVELLSAAPNLEHVDVAGTSITARDSAAAAAAISSAPKLSNYHVGGADFVPVLGDAHHGVTDKVEVVVTLSESISFFCGGSLSHALHASFMSECGKDHLAHQHRLEALTCAVAHALNAAGEGHPSVKAISEDDVQRDSITSYATERKHVGKGDVTLVKMTVTLKSPMATSLSSRISESLSSLASLDTPAVCGARVDAMLATRNAFENPTGWKLPAATITAQVACGNGVLGRSCAYICPASWTKKSVLPVDVYSLYTGDAGFNSRNFVLDGINKGKSDIKTSLLGMVQETEGGHDEDEDDERAADGDEFSECPPGTTLDEAEQLAYQGQSCTVKPQVRHEAYQVFAFVGSAEQEKHATLKGDLGGCNLHCRGTVAKMNVACEKWAHRKFNVEAHAECKQQFDEVARVCGIDQATCDADPDTLGPKGERTKQPGSPEEGTCQPCGHFMYYDLHDVAGMGENSKFETHHSADEFNAIFDKDPTALPEMHESFTKSRDVQAAPRNLGAAAMLEGVDYDPDVIAAVAAQFGSSAGACSVMSNSFCAPECNQAVQSALDSCVAWTDTLHAEDYAASTSAAEACINREQAAKGECKASSAKCVEPVMRGFYAAGLKKNAVPRKAQLVVKSSEKEKVAASAGEEQVEISEIFSAGLGASASSEQQDMGPRGGIPAHIRATAHGVPGNEDDDVSGAQASKWPLLGAASSVSNAAAYVAATMCVIAVIAMAVVLRRRRTSGATCGVLATTRARGAVEKTPLLHSDKFSSPRTYNAI
jgi:hypothetical protein